MRAPFFLVIALASCGGAPPLRATQAPVATPVPPAIEHVDVAAPIEHVHATLLDGWRVAMDGLAAWIVNLPASVPDVSQLVMQPIAMGEPSDFGWRSDPFSHTPRFHSGADFRADPGTPVVAAGDGVVVFAGWYGGYGRMIDVDHGNGVVTRYAHLRRFVARKDERVAAGETVGEVGQSGRATGPHLHFEVLLRGRPVDPVTALTVADITRRSPAAGHLAAFALVPEMQPSPTEKPGKQASRPERKGRAKREQVLW